MEETLEIPAFEIVDSPVIEISPSVVEESETIPPTQEEIVPPVTEIPETLVYTTPEGEKYHTNSCRWVKNKNLTEWIIEDAVNAGYGPCGTCKPR